MKIGNDYDIIIIGAGIGGLVSAALLSGTGEKILIIEKEPKPGGYLTEFKSEDFIFDVSLHLLNGCYPGGYTSKIFQECGIGDEVNFLKPKYLYRSIFPDFDIRIPQGLDEQRKLLVDFFPGSKAGIDSLINDSSKVFHALNSGPSYSSTVSLIIPYLKNSYEKMLTKYIKDIKLRALLSQMWMYLGLPPSAARAADFCYAYYDYSANGGYYPEKGSYAITSALTKKVKDRGVRILLNKKVDKILIDNETCRGVKCGTDTFTCGVVIADIDFHSLVSGLIDQDRSSSIDLKNIDAVEPSISAVEVFIGLTMDLKAICPDDYEIFVNTDYDIDKQYGYSLLNKADKATLAIGIYSNINRFAAQRNKSALTLVMLAGYDYWAAKSKKEYKKAKDRMAEILLDRAAKVLPDIKRHIQKIIVSTPLTFERYTGNSKGAIYGYTKDVNSKAEVRPNGLRNIRNLHFASAWARQGSGIMKVLRSAEDVCKKIIMQKRNGALIS